MKTYIQIVLLFTGIFCFINTTAQTNEPVLATSQIGFTPDSPKTLTMVTSDGQKLPDSISFYIHKAGHNIPSTLR